MIGPAQPINPGDLRKRFTFHPASTPERAQQHEAVRAAIGRVAAELVALVPAGREASLAVTKLEEAMFWFNAAAARQGR